MGGRRARHHFCAAGMHGREALPAALKQNAHQVDDDQGVLHRRLDRGGMAEIGLYGMNLSDAPERLQMAGEIGTAHGGADAVSVAGERVHDMPAEKTGSAEDRNERVGIGDRGHGRLRRQGQARGATRSGAVAGRHTRSVHRCIGANGRAGRGHAAWSAERS